MKTTWSVSHRRPPPEMARDALVHRPIPRQLVFLVWAGVALLLFIGILASEFRAVRLVDFFATLEPIRNTILAALGIIEPDALRRADAIARMDGKFAAHAVATFVHVGFGTLLFVLVPLQFSKIIRSRYRAFHRWAGRLLVVVAWITGLGGLYFGVLHPFAGAFERLIVALISTWFLASTSVGYISIRRGQKAQHCEWMLRATAGALGISTVRIVAAPLDLVLTKFGLSPEVVLLHSFWFGWSLNVVGAEWWIRRTRRSGIDLPG